MCLSPRFVPALVSPRFVPALVQIRIPSTEILRKSGDRHTLKGQSEPVPFDKLMSLHSVRALSGYPDFIRARCYGMRQSFT